MKKDFKQELTELINKHSLEKEMRDTPDFILAQVCIDAMAVFSDAIARRDEWRGFRKADEKSSQDAKHNYPDDCNICKDRFKCADFMRTQPIANLIQRFKTTTDKEEKTAIAGLLKQINADASGKPQNDIPEKVKKVAGILGKALGARVEIRRIEVPFIHVGDIRIALDIISAYAPISNPTNPTGVQIIFPNGRYLEIKTTQQEQQRVIATLDKLKEPTTV